MSLKKSLEKRLIEDEPSFKRYSDADEENPTLKKSKHVSIAESQITDISVRK